MGFFFNFQFKGNFFYVFKEEDRVERTKTRCPILIFLYVTFSIYFSINSLSHLRTLSMNIGTINVG